MNMSAWWVLVEGIGLSEIRQRFSSGVGVHFDRACTLAISHSRWSTSLGHMIELLSLQKWPGRRALITSEVTRNLPSLLTQAGINENRRKGLKNAQDVAVAKAMEQKFI